MSNPRQSTSYEYVELFNDGNVSEDISGWKFKDGITFTFPSNSSIPPNGFVVVVPDVVRFKRAYPSVTAKVFGNYGGKLDNNGEKLTIVNAANIQVISFKYSDWYKLTNGYGPSLELICSSADPSLSSSWRSSVLPVTTDPLQEFSGTPGSPNSWISCPAPEYTYVAPPVFFSEIMYNPNNDRSQYHQYAWFEIYNNGNSSIDISYWRVGSGEGKPTAIYFSFPNNTILDPNQYLVVSKNISAFKQVWIGIDNVLGSYVGELGSGDKIGLIDTNGELVDNIEYDDKFPWPLGADGYAAGQTDYKGFSLERVSFNFDSSKKYNWVASQATPGLKNNATKQVPDPVVTEYYINDADPHETKIIGNSPVKLSFKISPSGNITSAYFEFFTVDGTTNSMSAVSKFTLMNVNGWFNYTNVNGWPANTILQYRIKVPSLPSFTINSNAISNTVCGSTYEDGFVNLNCPPFSKISSITFAAYGTPSVDCAENTYSYGSCNAAQSVVMAAVNSSCLGESSCSVEGSNNVFGDPCSGVGKTFAIIAVCSGPPDLNNTVIFPRNNDPMEFHGLFISPIVNSNSDTYHLFITPNNWQSLYGFRTFANGNDCPISPVWDTQVPAFLGWKGVAYPVSTRFQGSYFNRFNSNGLTPPGQWTVPGPTSNTVDVLSWSIELPNYAMINGYDQITIQKPVYSGCSYISSTLNFQLFRQAGIPAPQVQYARYHINGQFYSYGQISNGYSSKQLRDYIDANYDINCDYQSSEVAGVLYKASGYTEGVIPRADETPISSYYCANNQQTYSPQDRISYAYGIKTYKKWVGYQRLFDMISGLDSLSSKSTPQAREWFYQNFDVNQLMSYISIINWSGAWDDRVQNHFVYQRLTDNKWVILPWDMDQLWQAGGGTCSMYVGECGVSVCSSAAGYCNRIKSLFLNYFRNEYNARTQTLKQTILSKSNIVSLLSVIANQTINSTEMYNANGFSINYCVNSFIGYENTRLNHVTVAQYPTNGVNDTYSFCPSKPTIIPHSTQNFYQSLPGQPNTPKLSVTSLHVNITWDSPNSNNAPILSYTLQKKSVNEISFNNIYTGISRNYIDTDGLTTGITYIYKVKASNSIGDSIYSTTQQITITDSTTSPPIQSSTTNSNQNEITTSNPPPPPLASTTSQSSSTTTTDDNISDSSVNKLIVKAQLYLFACAILLLTF